jgi:hypothetical protein
LRTASSTLAWYDMKGMSATTSAAGRARTTAFTWCSMSAMVTGSVLS